jgi:hypothetical protein
VRYEFVYKSLLLSITLKNMSNSHDREVDYLLGCDTVQCDKNLDERTANIFRVIVNLESREESKVLLSLILSLAEFSPYLRP